MGNAFLLAPLPATGVTASSTAPGHDPAYVLNDYAGVTWRSAAEGDVQHLVVDLGADIACDTIMLFGLDGATAAMTLTVSAATAAQGPDGAGAWASAPQPLLAGSEKPVTGRGTALWMAPDEGGPPLARYWRLRIAGLGGGPASVARVVIGRRIQPERNFSYGGAHGVRDLGSLDFSARGVLMRRRARKLRTIGLTFASLYKDEVEAQTGPLLEAIGNTEAVALVTDPTPHPMRQRRCYFGPLVGELAHVRRNAAAFEAKVNLVSIF